MDEQKIQQQRREGEEKATRERAAIVGLSYLDSRQVEENLALVEGVLSVEDMYKGKLVPLIAGSDEAPYRFGVTTQTPQSLMVKMQTEYSDDGRSIQFCSLVRVGSELLCVGTTRRK